MNVVRLSLFPRPQVHDLPNTYPLQNSLKPTLLLVHHYVEGGIIHFSPGIQIVGGHSQSHINQIRRGDRPVKFLSLEGSCGASIFIKEKKNGKGK